MFFRNSLAFSIIQWIGNLISSSSSFSKPSLGIWKLLVHIMLKLSMQDSKHDFTSMGDECSCPMVSTLFSITLLGNWDEHWPLPILWPLWESSRFASILKASKLMASSLRVWIVVLWYCLSWEFAVKKAEHQRINAFELWCWRRLLKVPWAARRSSQSMSRKSTLNSHWKHWWWS